MRTRANCLRMELTSVQTGDPQYNSVYASFPLVQSKLMGEVLLDMGLQGEYDTSMPKPGPKWCGLVLASA